MKNKIAPFLLMAFISLSVSFAGNAQYKKAKYSKRAKCYKATCISEKQLLGLRVTGAILNYSSINGLSLPSRVPNYSSLSVDFPVLKHATIGFEGSYRNFGLPLPLEVIYSRNYHILAVGPSIGVEFPFSRQHKPRYTGAAVRVGLSAGYAYMFMKTNAEQALVDALPDQLKQKSLHGLNTKSLIEFRYYLPQVYFGIGFAYDHTRLYSGSIAGMGLTKSGNNDIISAMPIFTIGINFWKTKTKQPEYSPAGKQLRAKCCR